MGTTSLATDSVRHEIIAVLKKIQTRDFDEAARLLEEECRKTAGQPEEESLCYSVYGILEKLRGNAKAAWRHYEKAEKLAPEDPALKIILAKFLIEDFAQYDTAIKKAQQVLKLVPEVPSFVHQAHALLGIAYLRKGNRKKAQEALQQAMTGDFKGLASAESVNFDIIAAFMKRNLARDDCRRYLEKTRQMAEARQEKKMVALASRLLEDFP